MSGMAEQRVITHRRGSLSQLGRSEPRSLSVYAWQRFRNDRRDRYTSRIEGMPTDNQAAMIQTMIQLEWAAYRAEAEGSVRFLHEAREHRRLWMRMMADFERSLVKPPAPASRQSINDYFASKLAAAQGEGAK
jgi:hypothetical protein